MIRKRTRKVLFFYAIKRDSGNQKGVEGLAPAQYHYGVYSKMGIGLPDLENGMGRRYNIDVRGGCIAQAKQPPLYHRICAADTFRFASRVNGHNRQKLKYRR